MKKCQSRTFSETTEKKKRRKTVRAILLVMALFAVLASEPIFSVALPVTAADVSDPVMTPTDATYVLNDPTSGLADGTVSFSLPGYGETSEETRPTAAVLWWGDGNGKKLDGYRAWAKRKITSSDVLFDTVSGVMIPEGAKEVILTVTAGTRSSSAVRIPLPDGCQFSLGGSKALASLQIISDLHLTAAGKSGDKTYGNILRTIGEMAPESDGLVIVGDATDGATEAQYDRLTKVYRNISSQYASFPDIYLAIGNHEFKDTDRFGTITPYGNPKNRISAFLPVANELNGDLTVDKVYYDFWAGDVHCIVLGSEYVTEGSESGSAGKGKDAFLSTAQLEWLRATLEADEESHLDNPIFIFLHQALFNTVAGGLLLPDGTKQPWAGVIAGDEFAGKQNLSDKDEATRLSAEEAFREILSSCADRALLFNGHSHWYMDAYRNKSDRTENLPAVFNTSSASGKVQDDFDVPGGKAVDGCEGYFVTVYAEGITVRGYDFLTQEWISSAQYFVPYPTRPSRRVLSEEKETEEPERDVHPNCTEHSAPEEKSGCAGGLSASACVVLPFAVFAAWLFEFGKGKKKWRK